MEEKLLPHDIDAEEGVTGSLLIDGPAFYKVASLLQISDFYTEQNQLVYKACSTLHERREAINQITVAQELSRVGKLEICGGAAYLSHLISVVPTSLDIENYAQIVKRMATGRRIILAAREVEAIGYSVDPDINTSLDNAENVIRKMRERESARLPNVSIVTPKEAGEIILSMATSQGENQKAKPMRYGFRDLDWETTGIYPQETVVVGARTSVGKTQLLQQISDNLSRVQGRTGLYVSLEMGKHSLLEREVAMHTGIPISELRRGTVSEDKWSDIFDYSGFREEFPLYYLPGRRSSLEVAAMARYMKVHYGLDFLVVDYIQRLKDCRGATKGSTTHQLLSSASSLMKDIAMELDIAVIIASQVGRQVEYRAEGNRRPNLADLKESGSLEEDADVVLLLYREELYDPNTPESGVLEVKPAKIRQLGDKMVVKLQWVADRHLYANRAKPQLFGDEA